MSGITDVDFFFSFLFFFTVLLLWFCLRHLFFAAWTPDLRQQSARHNSLSNLWVHAHVDCPLPFDELRWSSVCQKARVSYILSLLKKHDKLKTLYTRCRCLHFKDTHKPSEQPTLTTACRWWLREIEPRPICFLLCCAAVISVSQSRTKQLRDSDVWICGLWYVYWIRLHTGLDWRQRVVTTFLWAYRILLCWIPFLLLLLCTVLSKLVSADMRLTWDK